MKRRVVVMAGNSQEASNYIQMKGLPVRSTNVISHERDLLSLSSADLHFVGTYPENPLYDSDTMRYVRLLAGHRDVRFVSADCGVAKRGACPKCYSEDTTNYSAATGKITRIWRCKDCDHRFSLISKKDWDNRGRETWRLRRPGEGSLNVRNKRAR